MAAKKQAAAPIGVPLRGRKLSLTFGLISVPVQMKLFHESQRPVPGKGMCVEHGPTLKQQSVCCAGTEHEHVLEADEKRTGYPHPDDKNRYVIVDPELLDELVEEKSATAAIEQMVDVKTIDPAYFGQTHLVWPQEGGEQQFDLLAAVLKEKGEAAVVTAVLSKQTSTIAFRWSDELDCLVAHVIKYETQIRHKDAQLVRAAAESRAKLDPKMVEMAAQLLAPLEGEFDASEVQDTLTPMIRDLIRRVDDGETFEVSAAPVAAKAPTVDLMAALEASVAAAAKPAKPAARKKVAA